MGLFWIECTGGMGSPLLLNSVLSTRGRGGITSSAESPSSLKLPILSSVSKICSPSSRGADFAEEGPSEISKAANVLRYSSINGYLEKEEG